MRKTFFALLLSVLFASFAFGAHASCADCETPDVGVDLTSENSVTIATNSKSDYVIIFSGDDITEDNDIAMALCSLIFEKTGAMLDVRPHTTNSKYEILIGDTGREISDELSAAVIEQTNSDSLVWGIAYKDGQLAFAANSGEALKRGQTDLFALVGDGEFTVPEDLYIIASISREQYDEECRLEEERLEAEREAAKLKRIEELKVLNASFDSALFGESTADFASHDFGRAEHYPTPNQHPRVNLNASMLKSIKQTMASEEMSAMNKLFWEMADYQTSGILKKPSIEIGTTYNWDSTVLTAIEAKALAYLLTGDELYAQEAIYAIKNCILTLVMTTDAQGDLFYAYGSVMRIAGEVYDWCYPVLTDLDREQIIAGVENHHASKMTIGCPPIGMNGIQGHGTSSQLAVDYLAFSIAIYDERPDWYNLVGARVYNEWYPFINYYYQTRYFNQGTATYADNKISYHCRSAWLMKVISGEDPIPGLDKVVYGLLANHLPNGNLFPTGDGTSSVNGVTYGAFTIDKTIVVLQALYPDPDIQLLAKTFLNDYTRTFMTFAGYPYTVTNVIVWRSQGSETTSDPSALYDPIGTVSHAPSPYGQIIARTAWYDENAPIIFMKIGETNLGNHDHEDSGTFQIYYKGLLSCNTGYYGSSEGSYIAPYGSTHHRYYHQATISSNGMLVYNPAFSGDDPASPASYYYCGGQNETAGRDSFEDFLNEPTAFKATTTGYSYEYASDGITPEYAYISGDLSTAYNEKTVKSFERRMLAIFTADPDYPMLFYVFDDITSMDASFKKTFLLHTTYEPTVDGNTVSTVAGGGKLVLTSLYSGASIEKIGGEGKYFLVNGRPCSETEITSNHWGRVEISTSGEENTVMLNAMYVTDSDNDKYLETRVIADTAKMTVAKTHKTVVAFIKGLDRNSEEISFTAKGDGLHRYYISGMSAGSWRATVDGVTVANLRSEDEGGFISFIAPAGEVKLIPGIDVKPSNSGAIKFNLNGAVLPEGTEEFYIYDEPYVLPTPIHPNEAYTFAGWYTDTTYSQKITEIPAGTRGTFKVYAMFYTNYVEDYETNEVDVTLANKVVGDMNYVLKDKPGASAKTVTENGNTFLVWHKGENDPRIGITKPLNAFLLDRTFLTISVDVALDGNNAPIKSYIRLRGELSKYSISIFGIDESGTVLLGNNAAYPITKLTNEFQTLVFTADIANEMIYAYDEEGRTVAEMPMAVPSVIETSVLEWAKNNTYHVFDWYSVKTGVDASLRIDNITVTGDYYKDALSPPGTLAINYMNMENGALGADAPTYFIEGEGLDELPTPTSDAFKFLGWYSDPELTVPVTSIGKDASAPVTLYAAWELSDEIPDDVAVVLYNPNGGTYDKSSSVVMVGEALTLGTPKKNGYAFGGWYTSQDFSKESFVGSSYTPTAGGTVTLYAEFYSVINEDYETSKVDATESTVDIGEFKYVGKNKIGSGFLTVTDSDANTYLVWSVGANDPQLDKRGVLSSFLDDRRSISFEIDIAKDASKPAIVTTFRLRGASSKYGIPVFTTNANAEVYLGSNTEDALLTLTSEFTRIRITVDFDTETIYAFDENANIIKEAPIAMYYEDPITLDGFIESAQTYIFNWYAYSSSADDAVLLVDNFTVKTGYIRPVREVEYSIEYSGIDEAVLPDGAPTSYIGGEGLDSLPTPTREGYKFDGWYLDETFTTPVTSIGALRRGDITLYAKWTLPIIEKDGKTNLIFEVYGAEYPYAHTEIDTAVEFEPITPVLDGFDFVGWYTSPSFTADSFVGTSFVSTEDGTVTLYARFVKVIKEDYENKSFNVSGEDYTDESGIKYIGTKAAAVFRTESDENGNTYLVWEKGTADSTFSLRKSIPDTIGSATKITFSLDVALNGDAPATRSQFRLRGTSSSNSVVLFWVDYSGNITLGDSGKKITTLSADFTGVSVTVDLVSAKLYATDKDGIVIAETDFVVPSAYATPMDYINSCAIYTFEWWATSKNNTAPELKIDNIQITYGF